MTTYTAITNDQIDQDSPITQPLMTTLRDNPIAIAEGATGAPKISPDAFSGVTAEAYMPSATSSTPVDLTNFVRPKTVQIDYGFSTPATTGTYYFYLKLSDDGGATWGAAQQIASGTASWDEGKRLHVDLTTGAWVKTAAGTSARTTGTFTLPSGATNALRFYTSAIGCPTWARVYVWAGLA